MKVDRSLFRAIARSLVPWIINDGATQDIFNRAKASVTTARNKKCNAQHVIDDLIRAFAWLDMDHQCARHVTQVDESDSPTNGSMCSNDAILPRAHAPDVDCVLLRPGAFTLLPGPLSEGQMAAFMTRLSTQMWVTCRQPTQTGASM